jgi:hypothetical protein
MANPWEKYSAQESVSGPWSNYAPVKQEPTIMDKVGDFFSGNLRETEQQANLPELQESGILAGEDAALTTAITPALLTATDPNEIAQIISSNFPNVGVTYNKDKQGGVYPMLVNNETGAATVINKPGMSTLDVMQGIGIASAYAPASKSATIPTLMAKAALTESGIQGVQSASGGEFDTEEVAISALGTGAGELAAKGLGKVAKNIGSKLATKADDAVSDAAIAEAARLGQQLSPEAQAAQQTELLTGISKAASAKPKQQVKQLKELTGQPSIDPERLAAAESLGVADELMPSQLGRNQSYIEIEQGLASIPGSQLSTQSKNSIEKVAQTADNLIEEFGGTTEKAQLSMVMKDQILKSIDDLDESASVVYEKLNQQIPKSTKVDTSNLTDKLLNEAADLGEIEDLEGLEKKIFNLANREGGVSYALLDRERKKVGEALRKAQGPYKDESSSTLKRLYGMLTETQEQAIKDLDIEDAGLVSQWDAAKQLVIKRKELEDNSILLLGKDKAAAIMPKIGQSMKKLTTGDYKDFDNTMRALPPELREQAVVSALNDVFTMGSRKEKQLSAPGFVDWYKGAKRNGSLNRVEKHLPEGASKRLNEIYKVAEGMRNASAEKITTGRINTLLKEFGEDGGALSKVYQVGKRAAMAEGATSSMGVPGVGSASVITQALTKDKTPLTESADAMLSSPAFKRAAMSYAESSGQATNKQKAAESALEKSADYQKWLSILPSKERQGILRLGFMTWLSSGQDNQARKEQPSSTK